MNRGYAGFYKGIYLRSSYEYAYALYLDEKGIKWTYEEQSFQLDDMIYLPDFFIYNKEGKLEHVIDTKSEDKRQIELAEEKIKSLQGKFGIKCYLVRYERLKELYKEMPFSLTRTINEWINSEHTTINKSQDGEKNPHYNMKHSEETKRLIGEKTRERWKNPKTKKRMLAGSKKGAAILKSTKGTWFRKERIEKICAFDGCGKVFPDIAESKQQYCSVSCASLARKQTSTSLKLKPNEDRKEVIKQYVQNWANKNSNMIKNSNYKQTSKIIDEFLMEVQAKFILEKRALMTILVGVKTSSKKQLFNYLKEIVGCELEKVDTPLFDDGKHTVVSEVIHSWANENKEYVQSVNFQKVQKSLMPLVEEIETKTIYKVDKRLLLLGRSIFRREASSTEVLKYLKNLINNEENVR